MIFFVGICFDCLFSKRLNMFYECFSYYGRRLTTYSLLDESFVRLYLSTYFVEKRTKANIKIVIYLQMKYPFKR